MASSILPTVDLGEKGNVQGKCYLAALSFANDVLYTVAQSLESEGAGRAGHRRRVRSIAVEPACGMEVRATAHWSLTLIPYLSNNRSQRSIQSSKLHWQHLVHSYPCH